MKHQGLTLEAAQTCLRSLLVSAELVEVRAQSMIIELIFQKMNAEGTAVQALSFCFGIAAKFIEEDLTAKEDRRLDFHEARAFFLATIYLKLGQGVRSIDLMGSGSIKIAFDSSAFLLTLDEEDLSSDQDVWSLKERNNYDESIIDRSVLCVPGIAGVEYYEVVR